MKGKFKKNWFESFKNKQQFVEDRIATNGLEAKASQIIKVSFTIYSDFILAFGCWCVSSVNRAVNLIH